MKITHKFLLSNFFIKDGLGYYRVLSEYETYVRFLVYHTNGNLLVMEKKFHSSPVVKIKNVEYEFEILQIAHILSSNEIRERNGTNKLYRHLKDKGIFDIE